MSSSKKWEFQLKGDKLLVLAKLNYYKEVEHLKVVAFSSEYERSSFLLHSREGYFSAVSLITNASNLMQQATNQTKSVEQNDGDISSNNLDQDLVNQYLEYIELAVGFAVIGINNLTLRMDYLTKVSAHAKELELRMSNLNQNELVIETQKLAEELQVFKSTTFEALARKADPSSRLFAKPFTPKSFPEEVKRVQNILAIKEDPSYNQSFENLTAEQRMKVYEEILTSNGIKTQITKYGSMVLKGVAGAAILFTVGLIVYDVIETEGAVEKVLVASTDILQVVASTVLGAAAESAAATLPVTLGIVTTEVIEASAFMAISVGAGALVVGFVVGYVAAELIGWFFHKFVLAGGDHANVVKHRQFPQIHIYGPPMPDAMKMANQLAYKGN